MLTFGTFAFIDIGIFMAGRVRPGLFVSYNSFQCWSKMVDLGFRFIVLLSSMSQHEVVHEEVAQCGQLYRRPPSRDLVATCWNSSTSLHDFTGQTGQTFFSNLFIPFPQYNLIYIIIMLIHIVLCVSIFFQVNPYQPNSSDVLLVAAQASNPGGSLSWGDLSLG